MGTEMKNKCQLIKTKIASIVNDSTKNGSRQKHRTLKRGPNENETNNQILIIEAVNRNSKRTT